MGNGWRKSFGSATEKFELKVLHDLATFSDLDPACLLKTLEAVPFYSYGRKEQETRLFLDSTSHVGYVSFAGGWGAGGHGARPRRWGTEGAHLRPGWVQTEKNAVTNLYKIPA